MAVEIKYVVVREGQEKMSFASKKEADAYDKMLDLAEVLGDWLQQSPVAFEEGQSDALAMWLAENKDALSTVLRSSKLPDVAATASVQETPDEDNVAAHPGRKRTKAA
ncbi:YebG family protein [Cedecea colo]|uniref:LexA family transcriptional regulator n=1 Tax=Cedecea colo TaxID=2552946 RepID=A0ABX0VKK0_9ENTR|nr:YebG family protein [Cedecea colo]NIY46885.1 LexA family transcriptional regulator [Cedecea colo]